MTLRFYWLHIYVVDENASAKKKKKNLRHKYLKDVRNCPFLLQFAMKQSFGVVAGSHKFILVDGDLGENCEQIAPGHKLG